MTLKDLLLVEYDHEVGTRRRLPAIDGPSADEG
jgi:hypothetical protein